MIHRVTVRTASPARVVAERLRAVTDGGPFHAAALAPRGEGLWTFTLGPTRPTLAIGFGKVAELLVLLGREFDVIAIDRLADGPIAAAG